MRLVTCNHAQHAEAIRAIYNDAIVNTTALFDYKPRSAAMIAAWFELKTQKNFPVIGFENEAGELLGFASYGVFRAFPAYKYSVEHSVYVRQDQRGQGLGRRLIEALIEEAIARDVHVMIGAIESTNQASIALHEALGFELSGVMKEVGFKFGRWLDVSFYQKTLATPAQPIDG